MPNKTLIRKVPSPKDKPDPKPVTLANKIRAKFKKAVKRYTSISKTSESSGHRHVSSQLKRLEKEGY
jgi:hypothetical protein